MGSPKNKLKVVYFNVETESDLLAKANKKSNFSSWVKERLKEGDVDIRAEVRAYVREVLQERVETSIDNIDIAKDIEGFF